jgi:hypothetical protein
VEGNAATSRSLSLEWDQPLLRDRNGVIQDYRVILVSLDVPSVSFSSFIVTESRIGITALHPYYAYNLTVAAGTRVGYGPASAPFTIRTFQDSKNALLLLAGINPSRGVGAGKLPP